MIGCYTSTEEKESTGTGFIICLWWSSESASGVARSTFHVSHLPFWEQTLHVNLLIYLLTIFFLCNCLDKQKSSVERVSALACRCLGTKAVWCLPVLWGQTAPFRQGANKTGNEASYSKKVQGLSVYSQPWGPVLLLKTQFFRVHCTGFVHLFIFLRMSCCSSLQWNFTSQGRPQTFFFFA